MTDIVDPSTPSVKTTAPCLKCRTPLPIGVTMDEAGNILEVDGDWVDFWAHAWTHEVRA